MQGANITLKYKNKIKKNLEKMHEVMFPMFKTQIAFMQTAKYLKKLSLCPHPHLRFPDWEAGRKTGQAK